LQNGNNREIDWREKIVKVWIGAKPSNVNIESLISPRPKLSDNILKLALESVEPNMIKNLSVMDFDPLEIARQITYLDFKLLRNCNINEFFNFNQWDNEKVCPTLKEFGKFHQKVHNWVCSEIVNIYPYTPAKAKKVIKHFLQVAEHLLIFQNFNSLLALMGGLSHWAISRLNKAWKITNTKIYKKLKKNNFT